MFGNRYLIYTGPKLIINDGEAHIVKATVVVDPDRNFTIVTAYLHGSRWENTPIGLAGFP